MALILFVSALFLGVALVWWLRLPLYPFEAVALAIVIGLFSWTWLAFLAALMLPYHLAIPLTIGVSAGAGVVLGWNPHRRAPALVAPAGGRTVRLDPLDPRQPGHRGAARATVLDAQPPAGLDGGVDRRVDLG